MIIWKFNLTFFIIVVPTIGSSAVFGLMLKYKLIISSFFYFTRDGSFIYTNLLFFVNLPRHHFALPVWAQIDFEAFGFEISEAEPASVL